MNIDAAGCCEAAVQIASPNHNQRPVDEIDLLVIHGISLPAGEFGGDDVIKLFTNTLDCEAGSAYEDLAGLTVSAHFWIRRDGSLIQFVSTEDRAWHAGRSSFEGREECNDFSIGIELEGTDSTPYEDAQYETLTALTQAIQARYPLITQERIVGHEHIAPGRKTDPGPAFDWARYREALV